MWIQSLELRNFRNLESKKYTLESGLNLFIGKNAQGKTNFLESIFIHCRRKTFRSPQLATCIEYNHEEAFSRIQFQNQWGRNEAEFLIKKEKSAFSLNRKRTKISQLQKNMSCILFSPESLNSIKNGPQERRKLLSELVFHTGIEGQKLLSEYAKVLKQRNSLLKSIQKRQISQKEGNQVLESINPIFFRAAADLNYISALHLRELFPFYRAAAKELLGNVDIYVEYVVSEQNSLHWSYEEHFNAIQQLSSELKASEIASGTSLFGPHKHDLNFLIDGRSSRFFCSQGQQRALILAFKMAQIVYYEKLFREPPLLLLDDVMSELDEDRRQYLVEFLLRNKGQTLITTTDISFQNQLVRHNLNLFEVQDGKVKLQEQEEVLHV